MSHQNRLQIFPSLLLIIVFIFNMGSVIIPAAPTALPRLDPTGTPIDSRQPTQTPTPSVQPGAEPEAWLDGSIDVDQFGPMEQLTVHFNTPMSPESNPLPILSWPGVEGVSSWDDTKTVLTFRPGSALDSKKTYTFFLNPTLHSADGKTLKNSPEWTVHVQKGPEIQSLSPQPGSLGKRYRTIEVHFDRGMKRSSTEGMLSIQPQAAFDLKWKTDRNLQIILEQPLEPGQRYDLTLNGGHDENALFAADGTYLAEDYRWFYWQEPFDVKVDVMGERAIAVKFNYVLDEDKSGLPFAITLPLAGKWQWYSDHELRFIANEAIPASKEFSLILTQPLVDTSGFETSTIPAISFSGVSPVRLANGDISQSEDGDAFIEELDVEALQLEFRFSVDHASAEKAFSLTPTIPGKFRWEKAEDGSKETLVYALNELLKPDSTYKLKIDSTVLDVSGKEIMLHPYEQSLMTNSWWGYVSPSFGEVGENVQVVNANGQRGIQFGGGDDETDFVAYRFDLIDFAKLYADHYHSRRGNVRDIPIPSDLEPAAVWKNIVTRGTGEGEVVETILPFDLNPGLYVVNIRHKNILYDQMFVALTSSSLVVKHNGNELFVWLTDINGENVPEAEIRVYSTRGEKIREGRTDENGQYRVPLSNEDEPMLVSARVEEPGLSGDVTIAGFDGWGSRFENDYYYWGDSYDLPEGKPYLTYLYTERPIYKPGQAVNFKAIVRKDDDVRYSLPGDGTPVKLRVRDARGNTIENLELLTNRFGTVNGTFNISEGAMLGHYQIEADVEGVITSQTFQVEDYRKPDYQIKLTSLQPEKEDKFVRGDEMKVKIDASYYFGEPLANAHLDVNFYYNWELKTKITGPRVTDENGETTLSFPAPYNPDYDSYYYWWSDSPRAQRVRMEVTANDGSNQTVTGVYYFTVYAASEQLKLDTGGYFVQPGETFTATAQALDLFDQPVADRSLTLTTASWSVDNFDFNGVDQTMELRTDPQGIAKQDLKLKAGYHKLTLKGKDPQGHGIEVKRWVYVFSGKEDWFQRNRDQFVAVSAEKDSYKPYETARLAIESTFSGPALLTFERGSVINTKMVELTAPLTIVETEIIPEHAPNVYVTVNAWQAGSQDVGRYGYPYSYATYADSYLRLAKTEIQVDSSAKALDIKIAPDKQIYAPGETLNATIQIKDSTGKPVTAELSLAVVDEAIYGLANDFSEDIFDAFYGPRGHSVRTFDSMAPYRIIMEGGRGGGGDETVPPARTDFPDTSAWLPVIETDANGQATVSIDLPDNTTSWRLSVKAVTLNHQVGQAVTNVETKKDLFVRPVLPRVLTNGDQATLTAFIHNYSLEEQTVTVNLSAPGLEIRGQNDQQITVQPGKVRALGWQVRVQSAKPTQVTITARSVTGVLDSILLPLALQPAAVQDVQNQSGEFSGTLTLGLPLPDVERETSQVRLTLNRSMSGTLLNGLEYLTGYPYGCVEQTMSRALPNAVVARAAEKLGVGGPEMQKRLEPLVQASIQRLYGLQHSDGGWGWWTDDVSDLYQTAWVLFGLGVMQDAGYSIEPKVMDKAAEWLSQQVGDYSELDIRTRAYALYSLAQAGRGDLGKTQALVSASIYELDPFSQAALALALNRLGEKEEAGAILDLLSQSALKEGEFVSWPQPSYDGEYHSKTMASTVRTTALALQAYAEIDPENELVPGIVKYLADQRQGIYGWGTTNETSFTILALTEHLIHEEARLGNTPYEVLVNGKSLAFGTLEVGNSSAGIDIPLAELKDGLNTLLVTTQGGDPVYFDLSTRYDLLQSDLKASGNILVTRQYLDPKTKKPIERFEAGQLVKVEVQVNVPEDAFFMAVEDHLPGGLEALNEGLSAANQVNMDDWGYESYQQFYWQEYGYNYKEIRGDRVAFFITTFEKGTRTFTYYARATTPGGFVALPAQAYAMYDLSLWGRSESMTIRINK